MVVTEKLNIKRCHRVGVACVLIVTVLTGCATRQVSDTLQGSTAQRLVTYSLEKFIVELADQPEVSLENESVHLGIYFIEDHPMIEYARQRLIAQLELMHGIQIAAPHEPAKFQIDVYFHSIGTDLDNFGLTIPSLGFFASADSEIEILALDMFHGVTEGYAIVKPLTGGSMRRTKRILSRIRRDNVATPIIDFPVNQLD